MVFDDRAVARTLLSMAMSAANLTIIECRCCGAQTWRSCDPREPEPVGWHRLENLDGPDHVCGECAADPTSLDGLREEHPNVKLRGSAL